MAAVLLATGAMLTAGAGAVASPPPGRTGTVTLAPGARHVTVRLRHGEHA